MSKFALVICACILALGFQAPSLSKSPVNYLYRIEKVYPESFPVIPQIPWPPVRLFIQSGMIVSATLGAPPPNEVMFINGTNFISIPISFKITLAPNKWKVYTTALMVPHVVPGAISVRALNRNTGIKSTRKSIRLP